MRLACAPVNPPPSPPFPIVCTAAVEEFESPMSAETEIGQGQIYKEAARAAAMDAAQARAANEQLTTELAATKQMLAEMAAEGGGGGGDGAWDMKRLSELEAELQEMEFELKEEQS